MNEILQNKIEEAAKVFSFNFPSELFHSLQTQHERKLWKDEIEQAYIYGGKNSLQNQWISVEEALPKESGDYLVIVKQSSDSEAYFHEISTYNATDNIWFYVGKLIVTHWAPIPSLEGGKE
jgi:hypothetical protein